MGNVNITNDPESLQQIIAAQKQIIDHQEAEIKRMETSTKEQLKVKDQQISELGSRIDRLIELAQNSGNQWIIFFVPAWKLGQFSDSNQSKIT